MTNKAKYQYTKQKRYVLYITIYRYEMQVGTWSSAYTWPKSCEFIHFDFFSFKKVIIIL